MRDCVASSFGVVSSHPARPIIDTLKAHEMMGASAVNRSARNSRTPGAQSPWSATKPASSGERVL